MPERRAAPASDGGGAVIPGVLGAGAAAAAAAVVAVPLSLVVLAAATAAPTTAAGLLAGPVPGEYHGAVQSAAQACPGLPAAVLAAQLEAESGWNPAAVSPAGAQGIAQFMPGTWSSWGRDADGDGQASPFDPADAIDAQGRFMCSLVGGARRSGLPGDPIDLALAGYNAGWGAVERYRGVPPYPETTAYIQRIRTGAARYAAPVGGGAVWPVRSPDPITNGFGNRPPRIHYALGYHTGIDLNADRRAGNDYGQAVLAARTGVVARISTSGPLGLEVVLLHADGLYSSYAHLAGLAPGVAQGAVLEAGQPLGAIGCSGMSTCAPHLHFEVRRTPGWQAGAFVDPLVWLGLGAP